jgi:glyoxylase-like metal-dependent hydrolase (beta-lactamase superfamily II)
MAHTFHQISPHVYWLSPYEATDRPILGVISGAQGSLIVEAGNSPAHAQILLNQIERHNLSAPAYLFLTHWHWDHVFGAASFSVPTFAHYETARILKRMSEFDWSDAALDQRVRDGLEIEFCRDMIKAELPNRSRLFIQPPEIAISERVSVDLGEVSCKLIHVGGDHSHDSMVALVPEEGIAFLGDCIYEDLHHGPRRVTTGKLLPLYERLLSFEADYYLPSHHSEPLTRQALREEHALMTKIGRTVERIGDNREAVMEELASALDTPLEPEHFEIADSFLAGLRLPEVESIL